MQLLQLIVELPHEILPVKPGTALCRTCDSNPVSFHTQAVALGIQPVGATIFHGLDHPIARSVDRCFPVMRSGRVPACSRKGKRFWWPGGQIPRTAISPGNSRCSMRQSMQPVSSETTKIPAGFCIRQECSFNSLMPWEITNISPIKR